MRPTIPDALTVVNAYSRGMTASLDLIAPLDAIACCSPITREPLGARDAERLAQVLKALADPTRLRLVSLVAAHADAEACVCDLTDPVELSQPTVSHHLKVLVEAGILARQQRGKWAYYRIVPGALDALASAIGRS
jgi:ArsR family transcriptional regulator